MAKNKWTKYIIILVAALILLFVQNLKTKKHAQKIEDIFNLKSETVTEFTVSKDTLTVTLIKSDTSWVFASPDTGIVNEQKVTSFLTNIIEDGKTTEYQTKNPDNYYKYNVTDELGTHLTVTVSGTEKQNLIIGQSSSTWAHDYIRFPDDPKVYITNKKLLYNLSERASFWRK